MSLSAGALLALAPAASAASSTYAATELPVGDAVSSVAADPANNTVYAALSGDNAVGVIDGADNTLTAKVSVSDGPYALAVDQASDTVYAFGYNGSLEADVINGATNAVAATITLPGLDVAGAAVNPVTNLAYVAVVGDGAGGELDGVAVIDGSTDAVVATIPLGYTAFGVAVDTETDTIYAAEYQGSQVAIIDGANNTVTGEIPLPAGSDPVGVAVDPAAGLVYVADKGTGAISLINMATDAVSTLASGMTQPYGLALDTGTGTLYATAVSASEGLGVTYVIDTASGVITDQIPRGGTSIVVPVSGGPAYIGGSSAADELDTDVTLLTPSTANTMSPAIVSGDSFTFTIGQAGQDQLTASAIPAASFAPVSLPAGLTLSPSGLLSGTPAPGTAGSYTPTVTASNGIAPPGTGYFYLSIYQIPAITSADQVTFDAGASGSFTITATGYPGIAPSETGALPAGVTFVAGLNMATLSGTPAAGTEGVYPITITASNPAGSATQAFTLTVEPPPAAAVGVEGDNGAMYVQAPQLSPGWQPEGGVITGPPAVAAPPNPDGTSPASPLFLATGSTGYLYIRSLSTGWQQAGPDPVSCLGSPAAVITGATLTVACEGTSHALYYNTATIPATGLPQFTTGWTSLGGVLTAGPAIAPVGGTLTFFVLGTTGHIYTRTLATGFAEQPWACDGAPAAALQAATGVTYFACQGTNQALWESSSSGSGWTGAVSLGGALIGAPAIAATSQQVEFFVEGTTGAVYERTLTTGFTSIGGAVTGGAGATALN